MKKQGFTLAEVLITLGIIGVVAALTAPAIVSKGKNEVFANKLAAAVSNFEQATTLAMQHENVENINDATMFAGNRRTFYENVNKYMRCSGYDQFNSMDEYYQDAGTAVYSIQKDGRSDTIKVTKSTGFLNPNTGAENTVGLHILKAKSGITYFVYLNNGSRLTNYLEAMSVGRNALNANGTVIARDVVIDVNGTDKPNTFGRDIFYFVLGTDGILYPYGGREVSYALTGAGDSNWKAEKGWDLSCRDDKINGGMGCTGRVVEEGYKINY